MNAFHFSLRRFFAWIIGAVFFVSGSLKLMDPVGTELIVTEYLKFFHTPSLIPAAFGIGIALSLLEGLVGLALMTGVFRKAAAYTAGILTIVFTVITLLLLIFNPEMDCGCFGKRIELTHWQSFLKNVVLLVMAVIAFIPFKEYGMPRTRKYIAFFLAAAGLVIVCIHCARYLPLHDNMAFKPGAFLVSADEAARFKPVPRYVYEKDGEQQVFGIEALPDSTWTYVKVLEPRPQITKTEPAILEFSDAEGAYHNELARTGQVLILSAYRPQELDTLWWSQAVQLQEDLKHHGIRPLILAAAVPDALPLLPESLKDCTYTADFKTLVTLNRSNGGATYLSDGSVVKKWSRRAIPGPIDLAVLVSEDPLDVSVSSSTNGRLSIQGFFLYELAWLLLL